MGIKGGLRWGQGKGKQGRSEIVSKKGEDFDYMQITFCLPFKGRFFLNLTSGNIFFIN